MHKYMNYLIEDCYNEDYNPYDYEIIFINDGSKDSSQQVIEKLSKTDEKIK